MSYIALNVVSPKKIDGAVRSLVEILTLEEGNAVFLEYSEPSDFEPEIENCHFNVWLQCNLRGGAPQSGWIIGQDLNAKFIEAIFHTVWRTTEGALQDITPRADGEKQLMFIPDFKRGITLSEHEGRPALISYDNVRVMNGTIMSGIERIKIVPESDFVYRHGLATNAPSNL